MAIFFPFKPMSLKKNSRDGGVSLPSALNRQINVSPSLSDLLGVARSNGSHIKEPILRDKNFHLSGECSTPISVLNCESERASESSTMGGGSWHCTKFGLEWAVVVVAAAAAKLSFGLLSRCPLPASRFSLEVVVERHWTLKQSDNSSRSKNEN